MAELKSILKRMTSIEPADRPTMKEGYELIKAHRRNLPEAVLHSKVTADDGFPRGPDGELIKEKMAEETSDAKEKS